MVSLRVAFIGIVLTVVSIWHDGYGPGECTHACYRQGCMHAYDRAIGMFGDTFADILFRINQAVIMALYDVPGMDYPSANLLVYGMAVPAIIFLMAVIMEGKRRPWVPIGFAVAATAFALMPGWYDACIDFCVILGNYTNLGYGGAAFAVCVVIPVLVVGIDLAILTSRYCYFPKREKRLSWN